MWNRFIWLRTGSSFGRCEEGDETPVLIRFEFRTHLRESWFLKGGSVSWSSSVMEKWSCNDNSCVCCGLLTVKSAVTVSSHQSILTVQSVINGRHSQLISRLWISRLMQWANYSVLFLPAYTGWSGAINCDTNNVLFMLCNEKLHGLSHLILLGKVPTQIPNRTSNESAQFVSREARQAPWLRFISRTDVVIVP
jgi:hypothetical protein